MKTLLLILLLALIHQNSGSDDVDLDNFMPSNGRIANGSPAPKTKFLEYVRLAVFIGGQESYCGGSLISATWVLTSANCITDPNGGAVNVVVYAGMRALNTAEEIVVSLRVIPHAQFSKSNTGIANDIGLVELATAISKSKLVDYATLAAQTDPPPQYIGSELEVCGYGTTNDKNTIPNALQWTKVLGVGLDVCRGNAQNICTKWNNKDNNNCVGDMGGPLYNNEKKLVGIASSGLGSGCKDRHASVFVNVAMYRDWITDNTK